MDLGAFAFVMLFAALGIAFTLALYGGQDNDPR